MSVPTKFGVTPTIHVANVTPDRVRASPGWRFETVCLLFTMALVAGLLIGKML